MQLVDTHCHIHFSDYKLPIGEVLQNAKVAGVTKLICVGTTLEDSQAAEAFAVRHSNIWAAAGVHPHEAVRYQDREKLLSELATLAARPKVIAIGECGLDFHYNHSPRDVQAEVLRVHLRVAQEYNLPVIFHVREAFDAFWPIFDEFKGLTGVIHSFSSTPDDLKEILRRGLYVGLNGIMTFTKQPEQLQAAKEVPVNKLLLETDAPFLTPAPYRGTICEPKHVSVTAQFLADLRGEKLEALNAATTSNAQKLFGV